MSLGEEKYISATTYRRSGAPVSTATWIVSLDGGRYGFWTSSRSGKYKRLRNNPAITVQPSDARGRVHTDTTPVAATAELVTAGADFDAIRTKVRAKYGVQVPISKFLNTVGHLGRAKYPYGDVGVVVTPTRSEPG
ncbi:PPOX class F420-dependent oxidoreductase [Jatrophihabitans sp.]|uniref:PPOX class F420-dependent oxidoreductase n=1 Tax=Jatrophihabitans sp. TaxID=1932789 RepID=UPI002C8E5853|nr:PPOX class F420-dependent oxidoreductase [Jatrophihabitans sp.]